MGETQYVLHRAGRGERGVFAKNGVDGEGPLTYGNNVVKAHVGRWSAPEGDIPGISWRDVCWGCLADGM